MAIVDRKEIERTFMGVVNEAMGGSASVKDGTHYPRSQRGVNLPSKGRAMFLMKSEWLVRWWPRWRSFFFLIWKGEGGSE